MENVIDIAHLTKTYGKARGVTDLSLQVEAGDIFGFLGPNGAGKSTTLRCLLGLIHFSKGSARVLGLDVTTHREEILRQVGYMPSEAMFYPEMRVGDVLTLAADMRGMDCRKEARMLCEQLEVDTSKRIRELSLGNRKKVSIVCAMQHRPRLFLFDEPTSGLDPLMQEAFFRLVTHYNAQGVTCFLSSHVLPEVKKYCRHAAILREGQLAQLDTVENLTRSQVKQVHLVMDGQEQRFVHRGSLNDLLAGFAGHDVTDITITEPELTEVFMHYYEGGQA